MPRIKFMGSSHVHQLLEGDDFSGRLATPLSQTVTFDQSNNWVVDSKEVGLSNAACEVLLLDPDFKDLTGLEKIPLNAHQKIFLGMKDEEDAEPAQSGKVIASGKASSVDPDAAPGTGAPKP